MEKETVAVFLALLSSHLTWRAGQSLISLPRFERPMFFARLSVIGDILIGGLVPVAILLALITIVWGQFHLAWYLPIPLFVLAGLTFALIHNALARTLGMAYIALFPALGVMLGWVALIVTQCLLWGH